jgi:hypothetical protein
MPDPVTIPGIGDVTRDQHLCCPECGEWLENAVEYSTCPKMHGKLKRWLDRAALRCIERGKALEKLARRVNTLPVVRRASKKRKVYSTDGGVELYRLRKSKLTGFDLVMRAIKRDWPVARLEDGSVVFLREVKEPVAK